MFSEQFHCRLPVLAMVSFVLLSAKLCNEQLSSTRCYPVQRSVATMGVPWVKIVAET